VFNGHCHGLLIAGFYTWSFIHFIIKWKSIWHYQWHHDSSEMYIKWTWRAK